MKGKKVLITGANSGIGQATATTLAKKGAEIYMVCRSVEKAEKAQQEIITASKNNKVHIRICDFSSQASIHAYGQALQKDLSHLDVLVNNAGTMFGTRQETEEGLEKTFATNHIGYFLNTHYCLPLLRKGNMKRIVSVASIGHRSVMQVDFEDLQSTKMYSQLPVYCRSKLFNMYFSDVLAKQLIPEGITSNSLHPGVIGSNFGNTSKGWMKFLLPLGRKFMATPEKGSRTSVFLASSPKVEGVTGKYFSSQKEKQPSALAQNYDNALRLWDITMDMCGIKEYGKIG